MTSQSTMIQRLIITALCDRFHVSEAILDPENWDKPLTGNWLRFSAIDLTYLFFELERTFGVSITHRYLDSYNLCTINKMAEAIRGCTMPSQSPQSV